MCVCNIVVENKMKFHLKKYVLKKKKAFSSPVTIIIYLFFFSFVQIYMYVLKQNK